MAKLTRKSAKVFAEQANAAVGGIAQFGSLAAGDIQYSKDVDVIQALDAYKNGWASAVVGNKSPAMEDRNALDYILSYQQAYIMQQGVPEWLSTETYYKNAYVVDTNGDLRFSRIDNNVGHNPTDDISGQQYWGFGGSKGTGKNIGEVYFSQSKLATDNVGALPLFTGDLITNANSTYPQFYAWLQNHPEMCKTQAEYDTAISTYGECPFYVLNATSFRLPKLVNYIKMANSTNGITQELAGLPNITGQITPVSGGINQYAVGSGAFSNSNIGPETLNGGSSGLYKSKITFDASSYNSIYGNSNTVTPAHTTVYPWVCVYNAAVPVGMAQAAQFEESIDLRALKDFTNVTSVGKNTATTWGLPDYSSGESISVVDLPYTATSNGVIIGRVSVGSGASAGRSLLVNGTYIVDVGGGQATAVTIPVSAGDILSLSDSSYVSFSLMNFFPLKGAN